MPKQPLDFETTALKEVGLVRPFIYRLARKEIVIFFAFTLLTMVLVGTKIAPGESKKNLESLSYIVTFVTFSLGYIQWRAARHENSFEKYYDRLKIANDRFDSWRSIFLKENPEDLKKHLYNMFTFAELDNLEYVLEKFKMGFIRNELAKRAVRTFRSRCENSAEFRKSCAYWVGVEDQLAKEDEKAAKEDRKTSKGYEETTRKMVRYIIRNCEQ